MKYNKNRKYKQNSDYWMSYSDLMAGIVLVIILFLMAAIINYNEGAVLMKEQKKQLASQQEKLIAQEKLLEAQEEKIKKIIGIKESIISQLLNVMNENNMSIEIDENTGDIMLSSNILFDVNSYSLKRSGEEFLAEFIPIYLGILLDKNNFENISEIIIEGHTDDLGGYIYNLELSQQRSLSVSKYIYSLDETIFTQEQVKMLKKVLTSNGKSYSDLVYNNNNNEVDRDKSRRVEFKFRLKDEEMIKEIETILKD